MSDPIPLPLRHHKSRSPSKLAVNLTLDRDAVAILYKLAGGGKNHGRIVSRLLMAEAARQEERETLQQAERATQSA